MDVSENSQVAETLEEGIHKMMDRGRSMEHTKVSIIHSHDVTKWGGVSIQQLSVHW